MREGNELGPLALARTPQCVACELLHKEDYRNAQSNLGMCTLIDSICTPCTKVGVEGFGLLQVSLLALRREEG